MMLPMTSNQETLNLSPYMAIYDIVVPKDNMLRQINELVDFSFILEEQKTKYYLDNFRNAIPPIRMFRYLLLKAIYDVSDVEGAKSKTYSITIKSTEHEEQAAFQETEEFKEFARNRYKIEAKNSELKNPHGYDTAQSAG